MSRRNAFTLIELLVVISIIALLISILLPALTIARATARGSVCLSHMKQLGIGATIYYTENRGVLPHNGENYANLQPQANGDRRRWFQQINYMKPAGAYGSAVGMDAGSYAHVSNGTKAVLQPTALHCPQQVQDIPNRYQPFPVEAAAETDFSINRKLGGRGDADAPQIPTDRHLRSSKFWFVEGSAFAIYGGNNKYTHWRADIRPNTGAAERPYWWASSGYGRETQGHPGGAANFLFADAHAEALQERRILAMNNAEGDRFAGVGDR